MDNTRRFYVYEWFNIDTGEVFYVGKGTGSRWKDRSSRNQYFKNYYKKYNCNVRKAKEELTEEEAFKLEIELIKQYKDKGECKCNLTLGGEGATYEEGSEEWYRNKLRIFRSPAKSLQRSADIFEEAYFECNPHKSLEEMTLEELKALWERYSELKEEDRQYWENQAIIDEMWENDPIFRDIWDGIC